MIRSICRAAASALLVLTAGFSTARSTAADPPPWPSNSVIYTIYPNIFSPERNFAGVTAQLGRLRRLGVTVIWLMPVTPIGRAVGGHPSFDSPYSVHDYFAIDPEYGTETDIRSLVSTAHKMGLKVILDEVLNHTSWDNALITRHPEFYVHSDGDPKNPATIRQAFSYGDVAQLNYANPDLRAYMIEMLRFWIKRYGVDGFRFDSASNPEGVHRTIPADFWQEMGQQLRQTKPDVLLLGECETPDLAMKPFTLDYGWWLFDALKSASSSGDASQVEAAWHRQVDVFPPNMRYMSLQDNWDTPRDVQTFGGADGALAAMVFNLTDTGVPLIYNGMEIGNAAGGVNPHAVIDWKAGDPRFPDFYRKLIALRHKNPALHQGTMTWLTNSTPTQVLTYTRVGGGSEFLVEINLSSRPAVGTVKPSAGRGWTEVALAGTGGVKAHAAPPQVSLPPHGFAVFKRSQKTP